MTPVLDLYILAKLDRGLETPYDLQREAGLSLGAIVPALRRLLTLKLVTKAESLTSTKRPKHIYKLTKAGKQKVETGWNEYLEKGSVPADLDALLRLVDVAYQYGAKKSRLIEFLQAAAKHRSSLALQADTELGRMRGDFFSYRITRAQVEIERLQAEERALKNVASTAGRHRKKKTVQKPDGQQYIDFSAIDLRPPSGRSRVVPK